MFSFFFRSTDTSAVSEKLPLLHSNILECIHSITFGKNDINSFFTINCNIVTEEQPDFEKNMDFHDYMPYFSAVETFVSFFKYKNLISPDLPIPVFNKTLNPTGTPMFEEYKPIYGDLKKETASLYADDLKVELCSDSIIFTFTMSHDLSDKIIHALSGQFSSLIASSLDTDLCSIRANSSICKY